MSERVSVLLRQVGWDACQKEDQCFDAVIAAIIGVNKIL